jgi:serine/threonine protein kinase/Tol biopolymer transport system component
MLMQLSPGTRLGPYEILAPLGAGGMGEVYRARDTKLKRDVALKVLPEPFALDPDRMARFQREAEVLASLNHPNIAAIYGVEESALVMELVEGENLKGPLPIDTALNYARQIAEALEAAHEKGIIHRDLKPANVMITPAGVVKVLDFGLAKIAEPVAGNPASSPTLTMGASEPGMIMGTAAYMAPEQARGQTVDKRADIWAFGVVLYEMLTGRRLFAGETFSDTLACVLTKEPEWQGIAEKVQPLLRSCLQKDPRRRLRDIGDAWQLLDNAPSATAPKSGIFWKITALVLGVVSVIALSALWRATRPLVTTPQPAVRVDVDLGRDVSLDSTTGPAAIISPDGTQIVFVSHAQNENPQLFTRRLDEPKAVRLPGTDGAYAPFFSPDGHWVGFFARGKLKKIRLDGGEPISLCEAPAGRGASWGDDGNIIAALDQQTTLSQIAAEGGTTTSITELRIGEFSHRWPQILPGGKAVLFTPSTRYSTFEDAAIAVVSLKNHGIKTLVERGGMYPRYLPSGHLIYVTKRALFALPFDPERLQVRGPATLLTEVACNPNIGDAQLDFSQTGTLVYRTGGAEGLRTMQWVDSGGNIMPLGIEPGSYISPRLSPDGTRLAYIANQGTNAELWIYDWQRNSKTRLATGQNAYPVWSPDGRFVVFQAVGGIFWTRSDGAGKPQSLTQSKSLQLPTSFAPDGKQLVFGGQVPASGAEIRIVPVESVSGQLRAGESKLFLNTSTINSYAAFSPDGRWLAYASAEGGIYEVYVRTFPDNGTQVQVSNAGGILPVWSRNGHELFYRTEDQRIMVANYKVQGNSFVAGKPRVWFGKQLANVGLAVNFDLAPDGKRILIVVSAESSEPRENQSHVKIATNFFEEVRRGAAGQAK